MGRPTPSKGCKISPEDFSIANIFLKPWVRACNNIEIVCDWLLIFHMLILKNALNTVVRNFCTFHTDIVKS